MVITKKVTVTHEIAVSVETDEFSQGFIDNFKEYMYDFDTIDDHIEHLAFSYVRGQAEYGSFLEGYGKIGKDMKISFQPVFIDLEIEE